MKVKKGNVYLDKNPRMYGRKVIVRKVEGEKAICSRWVRDGRAPNNDTSKIAIKSLQSTRFEFVKNVKL